MREYFSSFHILFCHCFSSLILRKGFDIAATDNKLQMKNIDKKTVEDFGEEWNKYNQSSIHDEELKKLWNQINVMNGNG